MKYILFLITVISSISGCADLSTAKEKPIKGGLIETDNYLCSAEFSNNLGIFSSNEYSVSWKGELEEGVIAELTLSASIRIKKDIVSFSKSPALYIDFRKTGNGFPSGQYAASLLSDSGAVFSGIGGLRSPYFSTKIFIFEGKDLEHVLENKSDVTLIIFSDKKDVVRSHVIPAKLFADVFENLQRVFNNNIENSNNQKNKCSKEWIMVGSNWGN